MKKFLIMADTHGNRHNIEQAVRIFPDIDAVIHLGDYARDAEYIKTLTGVKVYSVRGNCDIASPAKQKQVIQVEGLKILAQHGHKQGVKSGLLKLGLYAKEKEADIALFGHTHISAEQMYDNVILYNPGSLGEPRGRQPSIGILTLDNGTFFVKTHTL